MRQAFDIFRLFSCFCMVFAAQTALARDDGETLEDFGSAENPIKIVVFLAQDELRVGKDPSESGQIDGRLADGSLPGGVFDGIISRTARNALEPSLELVSRDEFAGLLSNALQGGLSSNEKFAFYDSEIRNQNDYQTKQELLREIGGPFLLSVDCTFNLSIRFQSLYSACALELIDNSKITEDTLTDERKFGRALAYRQFVVTEVALANPEKSVGGRREQWIRDSGELLAMAMRHSAEKLGVLVSEQIQLTRSKIEEVKDNEKYKFFTAYVGMALWHRGRGYSGEENVRCRYAPNTAGDSYLYLPDADGLTIMEKEENLFYHWSFLDPEGPETKRCRS